jgi:PTH1 family peptidyl-tRNA hydrolase
LLVGLGNPGREHFRTRHNLGFRVVDRLASRLAASFSPGRGRYVLARAVWEDRILFLLKPLTFMNASGEAVLEAIDRYGFDLTEVLIICDDYQLPLGRLRLRSRGSDGGHRGLASVIYHLQSEEVPRLRIGIGPLPEGITSTDFVLGEFAPSEEEIVEAILPRAEDGALLYVAEGAMRAMSIINDPAFPDECE